MQILVVYRKSDKLVIGALKYNSFITEADVLMLPGHSYFITLKNDTMYTAENGHVYVREEVIK